jgi:hypothetical protein
LLKSVFTRHGEPLLRKSGQTVHPVLDRPEHCIAVLGHASCAYLPLDKAKLPNLTNLDPAITAQVALYDPGNAHAVPHMWGTAGLGYNEKMLAQSLPSVPRDSRACYSIPRSL